MSKETTNATPPRTESNPFTQNVFTQNAFSPSAFAPAFGAVRTMVDEIDRQTERSIDYSTAAGNEAVRVANALRAQLTSATRSMIDSVEQWHTTTLNAVTSFTKSFNGNGSQK